MTPGWRRIVVGAALLAALGPLSAVYSYKVTQDSRKAAINTTCATQRATIAAGRKQLLRGGESQGGRFERNLVKLGYPPVGVRRRAARQAADAYSTEIARSVERQSGVTGLFDPRTGDLRCDKVAGASNVR